VGEIIGLLGQARSGKDTTAEYLAKNYNFVRIGLADPMKRFCAEVFQFSDEQLYGDKRDDTDPRYSRGVTTLRIGGATEKIEQFLSPRYALQTLGTEWGRHCYNNIWIDYGIQVAKRLMDGRHEYTVREGLTTISSYEDALYAGVVFSDLRFINEYNAVKKAGGLMLRIKRPGFEGSVGAASHASELEQKSLPDSCFDAVLDNSGTFDHLYKQIDALISKI
jgi:hypothetical protein